MAPRVASVPAEQALGQDDRRHRRNEGAVTAPGDQAPFDALVLAALVFALEGDGHAAHVRAQKPHRALEGEQRRGQSLWLSQQAGANKPRQAPERQMKGADLERGEHLHRAQAWIPPRQEIEIGRVAGAEPSPAEARDVAALQALPTVHHRLSAVDGHHEGAAERAQDRLRGRKTRIEAVAGRNDDAGRFRAGRTPLGELRRVGVDRRGGQGGHRAGPTDDEHAGLLGLRVERADTRDEAARVGKIDVVHAGGDACARQPVVLPLVGARCVDQQGRLSLEQLGAGDISRIHAYGNDAGAPGPGEPARRLAGALQRATSNDQLESRLPR